MLRFVCIRRKASCTDNAWLAICLENGYSYRSRTPMLAVKQTLRMITRQLKANKRYSILHGKSFKMARWHNYLWYKRYRAAVLYKIIQLGSKTIRIKINNNELINEHEG